MEGEEEQKKEENSTILATKLMLQVFDESLVLYPMLGCLEYLASFSFILYLTLTAYW